MIGTTTVVALNRRAEHEDTSVVMALTRELHSV
jgi:hypothetical protein